MRWRIIIGSALTLLGMVTGLVAVTPTSGAAPKVVFGPPTIVKKVILKETSIDGPSIWYPNIVSGEPGSGVGIVIAWTGTDANHLLNTVKTYDGVTYFAKTTYDETSFVRPAVTTVVDGGVALAWTGANTKHSLNVSCTGCASTPQKLTLWNETSFTAPTLAFSGGKLWLAWVGTDANHSLNILPIDITTFKPGVKTVLGQFSSIARPSLAPDPNTKGLLLSWTGTTPANRLRFATSADGVHWTEPSSSPLAEWSGSGPSMLALGINNMPRYFVAWTGTDANHSVNVQYTEGFPNWPMDNSKTTFGEWALGGPSIAYNGVYRQIVLGWAGTDPLHKLNIAMVGM